MARINVDDCLFGDERWFNLLSHVGDHEKALGKLIFFWKLGQKYFKNGEQVIPKESFPEGFQVMVTVGFAEDVGDGIYVKGSKDQFAWLERKRNAGKLGGLAKASTCYNFLENPSKTKQTVASSLSTTHTQEDIKKELLPLAAAFSEKFLKCWKEYPSRGGRKVGKKQALTAFKKLSDQEQDLCLPAIIVQKAHNKILVNSGQFAPEFPDFHRWISQRRFSDEIEKPRPSSPKAAQIFSATEQAEWDRRYNEQIKKGAA